MMMMMMMTLFKSQIDLTEHGCSTNSGDCKSKKKIQSEKNLSPLVTPSPGIEPGTHSRKACGLTTAPILLPQKETMTTTTINH